MASIVFVSNHLYDSLIRLGIYEKKTFLLDYNFIMKNIPEKFIPSFVLGLFDGDGNIDYPKDGTISRSHVRFSGPLEQLNQLYDLFPFKEYLSIIVDKRNYSMPFGSLEAKGTIGKYCLLKFIYSSTTDGLSRKRNNAKILIERIENNATNRIENKKALLAWEAYKKNNYRGGR